MIAAAIVTRASGGNTKKEKPLSVDDRKWMERAFLQAQDSYDHGGLPIGSALVRHRGDGEDELLGEGHNQRVQDGDPIAHGEMDAIRRAGRQRNYRDTTIYTTLSPCMMCAGTIVQFRIPRVVVGENRNFGGNEEFLRKNGVEVVILDDAKCIELMGRFIRERPDVWNEDIGEE
jgi:cytosine deaminase